MSILDDTTIFIAVVQHGGFSRAAKYLGVSNGLVSRRIDQLESKLGVTLLKRTTRQLQLTNEGELFWQHVQHIQETLDDAVNIIQMSAKNIAGTVRLTAPSYFGRHFLTPMIIKFLNQFDDIKVDLILTDAQLDPIKEQLDLVIRGTGFLEQGVKDSSLQMRVLTREQIRWYASPAFLAKFGSPQSKLDLVKFPIIQYGTHPLLSSQPMFNCNDIESCLQACIQGLGMGRFTDLNVKHALKQNQLVPVLKNEAVDVYHLCAFFPSQKVLPKRTRLFLEFLQAELVPYLNA